MPFDAETVERPEVALSPRYNALWGEVLAWLDRGGDETARFNMCRWQSDCGTACCIGGYAMQMIGRGVLDWPEVGDALGMSREDSRRLFFMFGVPDEAPVMWHVTPAIAARVCRHWIATGKVDWSIQ